MSDETSLSGKNKDSAGGENIRSRNKRRFKRKCVYCSKWEFDPAKLILLPPSRTAVSESNAAHRICYDETIKRKSIRDMISKFLTEVQKLSSDEKNKIIVENLFGLKVIYPKDYYANLRGKNADYWRENAPEGDAPVIVKNNKDLKTHWIDALPVPDYYLDLEIGGIDVSNYSAQLLAKTYERLMGKNLFEDFVRVLFEIFSNDDVSSEIFSDQKKLEKKVKQFPHIEQANAIILILLAEKSSGANGK